MGGRTGDEIRLWLRNVRHQARDDLRFGHGHLHHVRACYP